MLDGHTKYLGTRLVSGISQTSITGNAENTDRYGLGPNFGLAEDSTEPVKASTGQSSCINIPYALT